MRAKGEAEDGSRNAFYSTTYSELTQLCASSCSVLFRIYFGVLIPIIAAFARMTHCFNAAVFNIAIIQTILGSAKLQMSADVRRFATLSHTRSHPVNWEPTYDPNRY